MAGRVKQGGAVGCCRLAFAGTAQGLERALQPQKLGCLLLPRFAGIRRTTPQRLPQRRQLPRRVGVSNAVTPGVPTVTLSFGYDAFGNRTSMSDSLGGSMSYTYDAEHNLTSESLALNGSTGPVISFAHDSLQRSNDETRSDGTGHLYDIDSALDSTGRLTNLQYYDMTASATVANYTYAYDAGDEVTSYQDANSSLSYSYDHTSQLLSATGTLNGSNYSASWSYDANGNRNMTGYQTGTGNELLNDGTYTYTYDKNGNTATQKDLQTGSVTYYTWDYENRLTEVKVENSLGTVLNDEKFTYDVFGNQIGESLNGTQQRWTVFDGSNPYIDFNGSGTLTERYLTNPNGLNQFYGQVSGSRATEWFVTDNLGSVRQVVDTSGNVLDTIVYDPYGSIVTQTNATNAPRFLYAGGAYDSITGDYQFGARWDSSQDGRWESQDPLGLQPDSNAYRYTKNSPVNHVDITGTQIQEDDFPPPIPVVSNIGRLPSSLEYPGQGGFLESPTHVLWNIVNNSPPIGSVRTNETFSILVYESTGKPPFWGKPSASIITKKGLFTDTTYLHVGIMEFQSYNLFEVTFRQWVEHSRWCRLFDYIYNVVDNIKKLGVINWPIKERYENQQISSEISKETIEKLIEEIGKGLLEGAE